MVIVNEHTLKHYVAADHAYNHQVTKPGEYLQLVDYLFLHLSHGMVVQLDPEISCNCPIAKGFR